MAERQQQRRGDDAVQHPSPLTAFPVLPGLGSEIEGDSDSEGAVQVDLEEHKRQIKERLLNDEQEEGNDGNNLGYDPSESTFEESSGRRPLSDLSSAQHSSSGRPSMSGAGASGSGSSGSSGGMSSGGGGGDSSSSGGGKKAGKGSIGGLGGEGGGGGKKTGKQVVGAGDVDDGGVEWGVLDESVPSLPGMALRGGGDESDSLDLGLLPPEPKALKKRGRKAAEPKAPKEKKPTKKMIKDAAAAAAAEAKENEKVLASGSASGAGAEAEAALESSEAVEGAGVQQAHDDASLVGGDSADRDPVERASSPPPPGREDALLGYDPAAESTWKAGDDVPFAHLAKTLTAIEKTSKRLEIVDLLTNALRCILATTPNDLLPATHILLSQVCTPAGKAACIILPCILLPSFPPSIIVSFFLCQRLVRRYQLPCNLPWRSGRRSSRSPRPGSGGRNADQGPLRGNRQRQLNGQGGL